MTRRNFIIFGVVCAALTATQAVFMFIPIGSVDMYGTVVRPFVYAVCAAAVLALVGLDERRVRNAHTSNMVAVLSIITFGAAFLLLGVTLGAGENINAPGIAVAASNLWEIGAIVILGEIIRCKLIKCTAQNTNMRTFVIVVITLVLAFGQMNELRLFSHMGFGDVFFVVIFARIVISAVMSFIAATGSFTAVLLLSFVYTMAPYLAPIVPNVTRQTWALIMNALLFATAYVYHNFAKKTSSG